MLRLAEILANIASYDHNTELKRWNCIFIECRSENDFVFRIKSKYINLLDVVMYLYIK